MPLYLTDRCREQRNIYLCTIANIPDACYSLRLALLCEEPQMLSHCWRMEIWFFASADWSMRGCTQRGVADYMSRCSRGHSAHFGPGLSGCPSPNHLDPSLKFSNFKIQAVMRCILLSLRIHFYVHTFLFIRVSSKR